MARLLGYFIKKEGQKNVNVLVATSGDTGSAVANGFLGVEGIHVYVLYPKGKVSEIQEKQFTTFGQNITALEVDGTFDDCQALVKSAFMDKELNEHLSLTSANSYQRSPLPAAGILLFLCLCTIEACRKSWIMLLSVFLAETEISLPDCSAKRMGLLIKAFYCRQQPQRYLLSIFANRSL